MTETKYGRILSERKEFPEDEPLFMLRGKDVLAPAAIEGYANLLRAAAYALAAQEAELDGDSERAFAKWQSRQLSKMASEASNVAAEMIAWQAANPMRVKLPD